MGQKMKKYNVNHRIIYLGAAVAAILAVIQSQIDVLPQALGIILYVLAAAFLAAACVCVYRDLRKGIIGRLLDRVKRTDLGGRFLEDYSFRTVLTTVPGVGINVAYTVYNGVIGVMNRSAWFITMTVYYSLLGIMRYRAVSMERKKSRMEDPDDTEARAVCHENRRDPSSGTEPGSERDSPAHDSEGPLKEISRDYSHIGSGVHLL